jgi:predicted methyltransferase
MSEHMKTEGMKIVLSWYQVEPVLKSHKQGKNVSEISPDLGISQVKVHMETDGMSFADGRYIPWEQLEEINRNRSSCFVLEEGQLRKVQAYSELLQRYYSLMPTSSAPTLLVSGLPMHRIKDTTPDADTRQKIKALHPVVGQVLDTATGLGYTAMAAAETAKHVTTIELDPLVLEIADDNPWSHGLFENLKITQLIGDSFDVVEELESGSFQCILHDPPVINLAGDLYSGEFYAQLYRLLSNNGRLFHYIGNPESKSGHATTSGVMRRLREAGFRDVVMARRAFGVLAYK